MPEYHVPRRMMLSVTAPEIAITPTRSLSAGDRAKAQVANRLF
jgi:hypothetical protein